LLEETMQQLREDYYPFMQVEGRVCHVRFWMCDSTWMMMNQKHAMTIRRIQMMLEQRSDYREVTAKRVDVVQLSWTGPILYWANKPSTKWLGSVDAGDVTFLVYEGHGETPVSEQYYMYLEPFMRKQKRYLRVWPYGGKLIFFEGQREDVSVINTVLDRQEISVSIGVAKDPISDPGVGDAVRTHFATEHFKYLRLETYSKYEYGIWSDVHHGPLADACVRAAGHHRIVAPADGSGLVAMRTTHSVCSDLVINDNTHESVKRLSITDALAELRDDDMLVLIYASAFLTVEDWAVVNKHKHVIVADSYMPHQCRAMPFAAEGIWSTVRVDNPELEARNWNAIPFSENLLQLENPYFKSYRDPYLYYMRLHPKFDNVKGDMPVSSTWQEWVMDENSYFVTLGKIPNKKVLTLRRWVQPQFYTRTVYEAPKEYAWAVTQLATTMYEFGDRLYFAFISPTQRTVRRDQTEVYDVHIIDEPITKQLVQIEDISARTGSTLVEIMRNVRVRFPMAKTWQVMDQLNKLDWVVQHRGTYFKT